MYREGTETKHYSVKAASRLSGYDLVYPAVKHHSQFFSWC